MSFTGRVCSFCVQRPDVHSHPRRHSQEHVRRTPEQLLLSLRLRVRRRHSRTGVVLHPAARNRLGRRIRFQWGEGDVTTVASVPRERLASDFRKRASAVCHSYYWLGSPRERGRILTKARRLSPAIFEREVTTFCRWKRNRASRADTLGTH